MRAVVSACCLQSRLLSLQMRFGEPEILVNLAGNLRVEIGGRRIAPAVGGVDRFADDRRVGRQPVNDRSRMLAAVHGISWIFGEL